MEALRRNLVWGVLALTGLVLLWRAWTILHSSMEWGVMDDATWIQSFRQNFESLGLVEFLRESLRGDLAWGLFRPTYMLWSYFAYGVLGTALGWNPSAVYLLCFGIYIATAALFAQVLVSRIAENSRSYWICVLLIFFSFTPGLNLINLISLQEKLALFFVALGLWSLVRGKPLPAFVSYLFALGAKSTAVAYVFPFLAILWVGSFKSKKNWFLAFVLVTAGWAGFARWVSSQGSYTSRYSFSFEALPDLVSRYFTIGGPWAKLVLVVAILAVGFAFWQRRKKNQSEFWFWISWPVALFSLLVLMLPWGILGYYWSLFAFAFVACAFVLVLYGTKHFQIDPSWVAALLLIPFVFSIGFKLDRLIVRSSDTRVLVDWLKSDASRNYAKFVLAPPCEEASGSLATLSGNPSAFGVWKPERELRSDAAYLTWWECPRFPDTVGERLELVQDFGAWKVFVSRDGS